MSDSPTLVEYRGNCHCGAFKFTFKAPEIKETYACNCSICYKNAYLWGFPKDFVAVKGDIETTLKSYEFANRTMQHKFCATCGTSVLARTADGSIGLNLRTLDNFDATAVPVAATDDAGASKEPLYNVPEPVKVDAVPEGTIVYQGSCHCGAVRYAHLASEAPKEATECNCSICHRHGIAWIYPDTPTVVFEGLDSLVEYKFAEKWRLQGFCGVCGVHVRERFTKEGKDHRYGLNIRTMNGGVNVVDLTIKKLDGKALLPAYDAGW
ncbi:Mss4-like protein [Roridomyces roridus]|uniref:Mss4-like protein n=1 Tax=Roridomyces roridus TaxID=1738132 RepID=A0AAD7C2D3_9AGAR|nr:Mss4-like protein [Roridomyces roridus]